MTFPENKNSEQFFFPKKDIVGKFPVSSKNRLIPVCLAKHTFKYDYIIHAQSQSWKEWVVDFPYPC